MGTASYMSPEQARGKLVDKRTDIWAYGCCLFEALTGATPFAGDNVTDILAAVVRAEPDWSLLPSDAPLHVRNVLRRCLKKKPDERLRDAGDARLLIGDEDEPVPVGGARTSLSWAKVIAFTLVAAIAGGLIAWNVRREAPKDVVRFATVLPAREDLRVFPSRIAVSPDGSKLVYEGRGGLYLRSLSHLEPRLIPGSASGSGAFFSPDGEWIAFFDRTNLVKMRVDGDTPMSLAQADFGSSFLFTGTWGEDDTIVISEGYPSALLRVHASTGDVEAATTLDERGEIAHYWPELLPGGKAVLYTAVVIPSERRDIVGKFLDGEESRLLIENGASPQYVHTGHLTFTRAGAIFAVRFDAERLEVTGEPFPVVEDVAIDIYGNIETAQFDVTDSGTLAYVVHRPDSQGSSLVWVDREGIATLVTEEIGTYMIPRTSPDGRRVAFARLDHEAGQRDIWVLDLERGSRTRLTLGEGLSTDPEWAPDGRSLAFASNRSAGVFNIFSKAADGTGEAVPLSNHQDGVTFPRSYLTDGSGLLFQHNNNIGILHLEPEPKEEILLGTPFREIEPSLSPDGRWLAYVSNQSGQREVYVQPFPNGKGRWSVSTEGGDEPVWSPNGGELFYRYGNQMMVVSVSSTADLRLGTPSVLFEGHYERDPFGNDARDYDVSPDGSRFLMIRREVDRDRPQQQLNVVVNWFEELRELDPNR